MLAFECGLTDTVDPLAGSYYVEKLTDEIERAAIRYIAQVDELGGAVRAIDQGYQQREIGDAAYKLQLEIENAQRTVVGVNAFQTPDEQPIETLRIDPEERSRQIARLERVRASRDGGRVGEALTHLERVVRSSENTMPAILACVEAYCTTGEICDVLRGIFGVQRELAVF